MGKGTQMQKQQEEQIAIPNAQKTKYPSAIDFSEKFSRQDAGKEGTPFNEGEILRAKHLIVQPVYARDGKLDKTKIELLIDDPRLDIRRCDSFVISVSEKEREQFMSMQGMHFEGVLELGKGEYKYSNMFKYDAKVLELGSNMPSNPTQEQVNGMERGESAIVEGTVVSLDEKSMRVRTKEGRQISLELLNGTPKFDFRREGHGMDSDVPEIGDSVRISAYAVVAGKRDDLRFEAPGEKKDTLRAGKIGELPSAPESGLGMDWCRSTYLLKPGAARQARYNAEHGEIEKGLINLEFAVSSENYAKAREISAGLIKKNFTGEERERIEMLVEQMPSKEQPLLLWDRYFVPTGINKTFATDIDRMTKTEFKEFCMGVAKMEIKQVEEGDPSYIYRVMDEIGVPAAQYEKVLRTAIESREAHFEQLARSGKEYDHERDWDDSYMLSQSIRRLGFMDVPTASSAEALFDRAKYIVEKVRKGTEDWMEVYDALSALENAYFTARNENAQEALDVFKRNVGLLRGFERTLAGVQVQNPGTTSSTMVNIGQGGMQIKGDEIKGDLQAQTNVSHKYSDGLERLNRMLDALDPQISYFKAQTFHGQMVQRIEGLAQTSEFFAQGLKAAKEKGYIFVLYEQDNPDIPEFVRERVYGKYGAVTIKKDKTVYFSMNDIRRDALERGLPAESCLNEVIADELVHVMSDIAVGFERLGKEETLREFGKMKTAQDVLESEKAFRSMLSEEILAQVAHEIVFATQQDQFYRMEAQDLQQGGKDYKRINEIKAALAEDVLGRVYDFEWDKLDKGMQDALAARVLSYLNSGEIEKILLKELPKLHLME